MPQAPHSTLLTSTEIADGLRELAREPCLGLRAGELRALAEDLARNARLDQWAEIDLVRSFVREESLARSAEGPVRSFLGHLAKLPRDRSPSGLAHWLRDGLRQRRVRSGALEAVMGVLVFIPLLVTWLGLREAVVAYGKLARENSKEATRPFLQLWQSGFGGHLAPLGRFENVALTTVLFIVLLVLLSLWHLRVHGRSEREEEYVLGRLAALLTQAQFTLVPHRGASPQQFARELTGAAKELNKLASRAERSHHVLTSTADTLERAAANIQGAAGGLVAEIPKFSTVADRLDASMQTGKEAIEQAGRANATAAQQVADRIGAAGTTVETALGTLAASQQALVAKSEAVAEASDRASQALVASTANTQEALAKMQEATERWDAAAAHWQDAAARVESGVAALTDARDHPAPAARPDGRAWPPPYAVPAPSTGHEPPPPATAAPTRSPYDQSPYDRSPYDQAPHDQAPQTRAPQPPDPRADGGRR